MGKNNTKTKASFNKYINFRVKTDKACYFPGEYIKCKLILEGKPNLKDEILNEPKVLITILQAEQYRYNWGEGYSYENSNKVIFQKQLFFETFIGANLLAKVEIDFVIQLPSFSHPTCIFNQYDCVKHFLFVEFPSLKLKRVLTIVVKHLPNFTKENKLLKIPCHCIGEKSKKKFFINKGNYTISIKLPKNLFYYDESIPYEIDLDYKELKLVIKGLIISLIRYKRQKVVELNLRYHGESKEEQITITNVKLNKSKKECIFKDVINFPKESRIDRFIFPPLVYKVMELNGPYEEDKDIEKLFKICPSCVGGLIFVEYYLKIEICFESASNELYAIPLDFCLRPEEKIINPQINQINSINSNEIKPYQYDKPNDNNLNGITIGENKDINEEKTIGIIAENKNINKNVKNEIIEDKKNDNSKEDAPPPVIVDKEKI